MELMLRFFALFHNVTHYKKPMKKFLNDFMKSNRKPSSDKVKKFQAEFKKTADAVVRYLGRKPFHISRGINAAVYDSAFTAFARHLDDLSKASITDTRAKKMRAKFQKLINDDQYLKWVKSATTDEDVVTSRIKRAEQILFG